MFINCQHINFNYTAKKTVIKDISLSVAKGKTLAIVGPSGCGKSTIMRLLSGILPHSKQHTLKGKITIEEITPDCYRRTGKLSFMFQEATLLPHMSVKENIALPLKIKKIENKDKINKLIQTVGLEEAAKYLPKHLSGGMKTRVALARSFSTNPELLLLDEPFSALDIAWKSKLYIELEKLREENKTTVIIVTHDVQEALLLSDSVLVMSNEGAIRAYKEIKTDYSTMQRVNNISGYMNSVYESYMLPIQDAIMNGQNRKNEKQDTLHIA